MDHGTPMHMNVTVSPVSAAPDVIVSAVFETAVIERASGTAAFVRATQSGMLGHAVPKVYVTEETAPGDRVQCWSVQVALSVPADVVPCVVLDVMMP